MNKYELAVVLSSAISDEERAAALEKVQDFISQCVPGFAMTLDEISEE